MLWDFGTFHCVWLMWAGVYFLTYGIQMLGLMASTASHADAQTVPPRLIPTKNLVFRHANGQSFRWTTCSFHSKFSDRQASGCTGHAGGRCVQRGMQNQPRSSNFNTRLIENEGDRKPTSCSIIAGVNAINWVFARIRIGRPYRQQHFSKSQAHRD